MKESARVWLKNDCEGGKGFITTEKGRGVETGIGGSRFESCVWRETRAGSRRGREEGREVGTSSPTAMEEMMRRKGMTWRAIQVATVAEEDAKAMSWLFGTPRRTLMRDLEELRAERREASAS